MPRKNSQNRSPEDELQASRMQDINEDIDDIYANWDDRLKVFLAISGIALKIDIGAWNYVVGAIIWQYAWWIDISVTDSATNYVQIDGSWVIQINTTTWNSDYARLATVVCSWWVITSISDFRYDVVGGAILSASISYNTKTPKTAGTTYQASGKWWLLVFSFQWSASNPWNDARIYSDSNSTPTTIVAYWHLVASSQTPQMTLSCPILPDQYYKAVLGTFSSSLICNFYESV